MDPLLTILLAGAIAAVSAIQVLLAWILTLIWREIRDIRERLHRVEGAQLVAAGAIEHLRAQAPR